MSISPDGTVLLSHRLLSALIIQDGSETADSIAKLQDELSQFSSKYSRRNLEERISLELRSIGLPIDAVPHLFEGEDEDMNDVFLGLQGEQENNDSNHNGGTSKAGKQAGLDIAKQTGRSWFNEVTSSDVVLSEPVCSKDENCTDDISSGTAANANVDSHDHQLGSWASGSSGATLINEKLALGPKVGTHQLDKVVACMPEQTLAKSRVLIDTPSVLRPALTLNHISPIAKRKRIKPEKKQSQVRNKTSANAGSSSRRNGRGGSKTKTKPKQKMTRLSSLGSGLESIRETSPVGVKQKKTQKKNTKVKSSAKTKTKVKEKLDQLSASRTGLGSIAEIPSSSSPSKGESGEPVNTGGTGINEVIPQDWSLDIYGLSSLEIPDDVESWFVDGLSDEAELYDPAAFLQIPMDDILDVNLCFPRK